MSAVAIATSAAVISANAAAINAANSGCSSPMGKEVAGWLLAWILSIFLAGILGFLFGKPGDRVWGGMMALGIWLCISASFLLVLGLLAVYMGWKP